eukprot:RCo010889
MEPTSAGTTSVSFDPATDSHAPAQGCCPKYPWKLLNPVRGLYLLGLREGDSPDRIAEKAITFYSSVLLIVVGVPYIVFNVAGSSSDPSATSNAIMAAVLVGTLIALVALYCATGHHGQIRIALCAAAVLFPLVHTLTHGCQSVLNNGGSMFVFVIPSTAAFLLAGGTARLVVVLLGLHLAVLIAVFVLEMGVNQMGAFGCPTSSSGVSGAGTQLLGNLILILLGLVAALLCIRVFQQSNVEKEQKLLQSLQLSTELAKYISVMDLDSAKNLRSSSPGELELCLLAIVENLEKFKPYLPDALFTIADDDNDELNSFRSRKYSSQRESAGGPDMAYSMVRRTNTSSPRADMYGTIAEGDSGSMGSASFSPGAARVNLGVSMMGTSTAAPNLTTGLSRRTVTMLLVDIRGFLEHVEELQDDLPALESFVISFLTTVMDVVKARKGTVVSFDGGSIVVCWNGVVRVT